MPETTYTIDRRTYEALVLLRVLVNNEDALAEIKDQRFRDGLRESLQAIQAEIERMVGFSLADFRHMAKQDQQWRPDGPPQAVIVDPVDWNTDENRLARLRGDAPLPVPKTAYELALEVEQLKSHVAQVWECAKRLLDSINATRGKV